MREYINVYQLDTLSPNNVRNDDYLIVSQNALSYKFQINHLTDFVIDNIDTTIPVYNANKLFGYGLDFSEPLQDHQLLTFDEDSGAWINKELDIDAVFRFEEYEPNKFLRLDNENKVITSDVYVSDIVVDTPDKADHFLAVHDNGSDVIYVDVYEYINDELTNSQSGFLQLLDDEIDRATTEESRLEGLIQDEVDRATAEEIRIINLLEGQLQDESDLLNGRIDDLSDQVNTDLNNEIQRATSEEQRIEDKFDNLLDSLNDTLTDEDRRLDSKIDGIVDSLSSASQFVFEPTINSGNFFTIDSEDLNGMEDCREVFISCKILDNIQGSSTEGFFINSEGAVTVASNENEIRIVNDSSYDLTCHIFAVMIRNVNQ